MSRRDEELKMLGELLDEHVSDLSESEVEAFQDMRAGLRERKFPDLTVKQHAWVERVYKKLVPVYENLISSGKAPRGREVPTPDVLKRLPLKPPGRKT